MGKQIQRLTEVMSKRGTGTDKERDRPIDRGDDKERDSGRQRDRPTEVTTKKEIGADRERPTDRGDDKERER